MDAILTAFLAAALCHWGDAPQAKVAAISARAARPNLVLGAIAVAAILCALAAGYAGSLLRATITPRALTLLLALALAIAGAEGLLFRRSQAAADGSRSASIVEGGRLFVAMIGGRAQLVTAALAGLFAAPLLSAGGAAAGTIVAIAPATWLGTDLGRTLPIAPVRIAVSVLFLIVGFVVAVGALGLS